MAQKSNLSGKQEPDPREKTRINRAVDIGNMQLRTSSTQYKSPAAPMRSGSSSVVKNAAYGSTVRDKGVVAKTVNPNKVAAPAAELPAGSVDIRGYLGDERTGIRKTANRSKPYTSVNDRMIALNRKITAGAAKQAAPKKITEVTIPGGGLKSAKVSPASSKSKPMAINRFTGSTLGFTSGKTTGSTVTKSGVAGKTTAASRAARTAMDKGGVAGPTKNAAGKNASSMTGNRSKNSGRSLSGKP